MATCRSCGRRIVWFKTKATGKSIPLDAVETTGAVEVVANGNIVLDDRRLAVVVATGQGEHVSHFATCPNSAAHRRQR